MVAGGALALGRLGRNVHQNCSARSNVVNAAGRAPFRPCLRHVRLAKGGCARRPGQSDEPRVDGAPDERNVAIGHSRRPADGEMRRTRFPPAGRMGSSFGLRDPRRGLGCTAYRWSNEGFAMRIRAIAWIAALLWASSSPLALAQTLRVGSKNFTEQFVVAELYAGALEAAGFKVDRKINLGTTLVAHEAVRTGAIDIYPEYTGTGLNAVMKAQGVTDTAPDKVHAMVKAHYEKEFKLTWLKPSAVNNGYAIIVRPETARSMNLKTLSDLAKVAGTLKLGAGPEFGDRRDGLKGMKEVYGIEFGEFRQFAALRLRYEALIQKQIDIANGFATDWQIGAEKFAALKDDKNLFPPYFLAPVVRLDTVNSNPKIGETLERVGA